MTTAWSHAVRGQLASAVAANSGGTLLALTAMLLGPWLVASGVRGRWLFGKPDPTVVFAAMAAILGVTLLDWVVRHAGKVMDWL